MLVALVVLVLPVVVDDEEDEEENDEEDDADDNGDEAVAEVKDGDDAVTAAEEAALEEVEVGATEGGRFQQEESEEVGDEAAPVWLEEEEGELELYESERACLAAVSSSVRMGAVAFAFALALEAVADLLAVEGDAAGAVVTLKDERTILL